MSASSRKKKKRRVRKDLRIAERAMRSANVVQLPKYAVELFRPHRYKVIWGGRGGARSWSVARALLIRASQQKTRILCAREIQSSIKDSVHQLLRDQIDLMKLPGFVVTDREIYHANGSLFIFTGLRHNATKVKSLEGIDVCWVEEAERISKESWNILIPTIRKPGSEIWVTFNPDQEDDSTYMRFIVNPPKDCWSKKVGWEDNPWLSPELHEEKDYAYAVDPESADHVWGGNLRQISDAQILRGKWKIEEFTVPYHTNIDGQREPLWRGPYQGEDFGYGPDPAAAVRCWIHEETLYVEHEMWKLHLELDETPQYVEECIPGFSEFTVRADSSRPDSISYLKRHGIPNIRPAKKHAGSVADGIAHLRSYRWIVIHPRCKRFIAEAKNYKYKVDERTGDVLPIIIDKHNHLIDATRYALDKLIKPRARVGFLFASQNVVRRVCRVCDSLLPDDGECPHCGTFHDADGNMIDITPDAEATLIAKVQLEANGNGNGHKHGNGNGNGNGAHHAAHDRDDASASDDLGGVEVATDEGEDAVDTGSGSARSRKRSITRFRGLNS